MRITNNSKHVLCVSTENQTVLEILPNQSNEIQPVSKIEFFLKADTLIIKKRCSNARVSFSVVSRYFCASVQNDAEIEIAVEKDSMLFGVEYVCALVERAKNIDITADMFYIKDSGEIDALFEERYIHNLNQDLTMDYIHSLFELPVVIATALFMNYNGYGALPITIFAFVFALVIFCCNRLHTRLTNRKTSKHFKIDKDTFYSKCNADYITEYYKNRIGYLKKKNNRFSNKKYK